jgi:drug/metabolite transporter superfamily protein YnfA
MFQTRFLFLCLLPVVLGALCLALGWAWDIRETETHYSAFLLLVSPLLLIPLVVATLQGNLGGEGQALRVFATAGGLFVAASMLWISGQILAITHQWATAIFPGRCTTVADGWETALYVCLAVPLALWSLGLGGIARIGLLSRLPHGSDALREWWSRFGAWILIVTLGWLAISALVLFGPAALLYGPGLARAGWAAAGGTLGVLTILLGKSGKTPATAAAQADPSAKTSRILLAIAAPAFV